MTLYESNYIRLKWLVPDIREVQGSLISRIDGECPLHLELEEHSPYTSTFRLTYYFEDDAGVRADPDLVVRVYHDAHLAEVRSCAQWHRHAALRSMQSELSREMGDRWLRNIMLNKWLDYLVERGHHF